MEENTTLATELLHELKLSARRWFIAFLVMVVLEVATIGVFVWYATLPTEEYEYIDQNATDRSINIIGDNNYGE